jgi:hypothetical protein
MTQTKPYDSSRFNGSAGSYAGQGRCSKCGAGASWMNEKATRAYCDSHRPAQKKTRTPE